MRARRFDGKQDDVVADREAVAGERAGHDRARALDREDPVDETAASGPGRAAGHRASMSSSAAAELVDALPGRARTPGRSVRRQAPCPRAARAPPRWRARAVSSSTRSRFVNATTAAGHAEHVEDLQVLLRLRLPSLVGGHHEQHEPDRTDARRACCAMNRSWPGTSTNPTSRPLGSVAPRVAQVDREPAPLLLVPAVGVDAGERDDQRGLAVVDVPGRRETGRAATGPSMRPSYGAVDRRGATRSSSRGGRRLRARRGPPGRDRDLSVGDGAHVEQDVVVLHPAEHRPGCRCAAGRRTRSGRGTAPVRPTRERGRRASTRRRPPIRSGRRARPRDRHRCSRRADARASAPNRPVSWIIRCTGISPSAPSRNDRERLLERGDLQLVDAHRARERVLAQPGDQVAATDDAVRPEGRRGACPR